jgi:hypothetical protein
VAGVKHGEDHVVCPGLQVLVDSRRDAVAAAPGHQLVDDLVAESGNVTGGEPHPGEAGPVARDAGQETQRAAGGFPGEGGGRLQDDHLADNKDCLRAQDAPRGAGVVRSHQQQDRAGRPFTRELEFARPKRGQDPPAGRHRRLALVELVKVVVQWSQRPGDLGTAQPGDEPARRAGLQVSVEAEHITRRVDVDLDDARDNRYRRGCLDDLGDAAQAVKLPAAQPDRGVPELLQRGRLGQVSSAGRDFQGHANWPKPKLVHRTLVRFSDPPAHDGKT